jgi:hypothetical protein
MENNMAKVSWKRLIQLSLLALLPLSLWSGRTGTFHAAWTNGNRPAPGQKEIDFSLPTAGLVSINITAEDGTLVRRLAVAQNMEAGPHTIAWDGLDDQGRSVAAATYKVIGLVSNLGVTYVTSLGNTSPQPYGGLRNYTGGEYREGFWHDVIMNSDGSFYLMNSETEASPTIQLIDPAQNYRVTWARDILVQEGDAVTRFQHVGARDDRYLYFVVAPCSRPNPSVPASLNCRQSLIRLDPTVRAQSAHTVDPRIFPSFSSTGQRSLPLTPFVRKDSAPLKFGPAYDYDVHGLGAYSGQVFVPFFKENEVAIYDGSSGAKLRSITSPQLDGPSDVWVTRDHELLVVDRHSVHSFTLDGRFLGTPVKGLQFGWAVTQGPKGEIIVSDTDANQVKYFSAGGALLRTIGPPGGAARPGPLYLPAYRSRGEVWHKWDQWVGGPVSDDHLFHPEGLAADSNGNLVVTEPTLGRAQVFDSSGRLKKRLGAQLYTSLFVDSQRPNPVFLEGTAGQVLQEYNLDWNTGQHTLTREWYPAPSGNAGTQYVRWRGNQPYFFDDGYIIYTIENNEIRVCAVLGPLRLRDFAYVQNDGSLVTKKLSDLPQDSKDPFVQWEWHDLNGDGMPQLSEYTFYKKSEAQNYWDPGIVGLPADFKVDDQWNITVRSKYDWPGVRIVTVPFEGFDPKGNPIYSWRHAKVLADIPQNLSDLSGGNPQGHPDVMGFSFDAARHASYYLVWDVVPPRLYPHDIKLRAYRTTDGKQLFSFGSVTPFFVKGRGWEAPEMMEPAQMPRPLGDFLFISDAFSAVYVYTREGLYAGTLLRPTMTAATPLQDMQDRDFQLNNVAGELWWSHVVRNPVNGQVYLMANGNAEPMSRLYRVNGLDQVRFFGGEMSAGNTVHLGPVPMPQ